MSGAGAERQDAKVSSTSAAAGRRSGAGLSIRDERYDGPAEAGKDQIGKRKEEVMPAYVINDMDVTDPALLEEYKKLSPATVQQYGGRFMARGGRVVITHAPDSGAQALMVVIMVPKTVVPDVRRAVSTTVRTAASPSAAHIAR